MRLLSRSVALLAPISLAMALAAPSSATAPQPAAGATGTSGRTVTLITGDAVTITGHGARTTMAYRAARSGGIAGSSSMFRLGSTTYAVPATARRYLGSILDPSLFDVSAARTRPAHLPVSITLTTASARPSVPGLVITSRSGTAAQGYLDASRARAFGDALAAQWRSDTAARRVPTSIMGGLRHLALAGLRPPARPQFPQVTLILKALDAHGRPASFAIVGLINVDDGRKYTGFVFLQNGQANVSVPRGHYSLILSIDDFSATGSVSAIVPVADFAVTGDRQAYVIDARRATVTPSVTTPRPASEQNLSLEWDRGAGQSSIGFSFGYGPGSTVKVAPTGPSAYGTTDWLTGWTLGANPVSGTPYTYDLSFHDVGVVPADQSRTVAAFRLATVNARYYSDGTSGVGVFGRATFYPFQFIVFSILLPVTVPSARTEYVSSPSDAVWFGAYNSPSQSGDPFGGTFVSDGDRVYPPGSTTRAYWLDGALTPGIPEEQNGDNFFSCYACRDPKHLSVALVPTTDSDPGHAGFPDANVRFRVWRNGTSLFDHAGFYGADLSVGTAAATFRVREDVDRGAAGALLSTRVSTDVTFESAAGQGAPLPDGWFCDFAGTCLVQPLLTARVPLPTDLDGTVPIGPTTIDFTVGHIQGASDPQLTNVRFLYSVDGAAFRAASVSRVDGQHYRAVVSAPRGSTVSTRVVAGDAAGGTLVQTAIDAYRVATS